MAQTFINRAVGLSEIRKATGADTNARATLRKQLRDMGEPEREKPREFHNVTPIGYAGQFVEQAWVSDATIEAVREFGGVE